MSFDRHRTRATLLGLVAVLLWAMLAVLTVGSAPVPPFLLNAICFAIGGGVGVIWLILSGRAAVLRAVPPGVYLFGTLGLFGYHALYFAALRLAPPAEAGLIAYLWPLLIVLFSGLLPGEDLRLGHILGALCGFGGAALIIGGAGGSGGIGMGHVLALGCALTWSGYSVLSRRMHKVPTEAVVVFCIATALLSLPAHLAFEDTRWPVGVAGWAATIGLGLGPVGLAFYVWDHGVKKGDIQLIGVTSYAAPLLSTFILVAVGIAPLTGGLAGAALLITGGALIAARASLNRGAAPRKQGGV